MERLLSSRYANDGKSIVRLNPYQRKLRDQVKAKVESGKYATETVICAVCDGSEADTIARKDRYGLEFSVVICRNCGLIFTSPRMTAGAYAEFYDNEYRGLYHGYEDVSSDLFAHGQNVGADIAQFFALNGQNLAGKRVLDVGCGAGGTLAYLRDHLDCDVLGLELGSTAAEWGRQNHRVPIQISDIATASLPWKPDVVIYSHVFEHILDLGRECRLVREILADEGILYIAIPGVKNIRKAFEWNFLRLLQNAHTYHFTLTSLSNVMEKNGFRLVSGDEQATALFRAGTPGVEFRSDYADAMRYLKATERLFPVMGKLVLFRRSFIALTVELLKKLHLAGLFKPLAAKLGFKLANPQ